MAKALSTKRLEQTAEYWRSALRLNEWRLCFRAGTEEELGKAGREAFVEMVPSMKQAEIVLRSVHVVDRDLEEDLVHELLHLVFFQESARTMGVCESEQLPFEFALNALAETLVRLKYQAKRASQ